MSSIVASELPPERPRSNARVALICVAVFVTMVGAAFAAVPLYRLFCQVTGFGGTVSKAEAAPTRVLNQKIAVRFDTNVRGLPWSFVTEQVSQDIRIGETEQAGAYFRKLECFCFLDQTLKPGQSIEFPVVYFVDPEFAEDFETKGASEITLSYTFFPVEESPVAPGA
jgi:cytochrome c oxidase assembly protein subunit 11